MKLLYLEDEAELARIVKLGLEQAGFVVDWVGTMASAFAALPGSCYDLLIIDRTLPDGEGLAMIATLRARGVALPILVASGKDKVSARVEGLNGGADDYLVKPFVLGELVARIRALMRRPALLAPDTCDFGNLQLDTASRSFRVNGTVLPLARREGLLLEGLMQSAGHVIKRQTLQDMLFGYDDDGSENAIEASVCRLRKKLAAAGADCEVRTLRGVGYLLAAS